MKDIYDMLYSESDWEEFYKLILENEHIQKHEKRYLRKYIDDKKYLEVLASIEANSFPIPKLMYVNKKASEKKRKVFSFDEDYSWILKKISVSLQEYDHLFADNLYSFRKHRSARNAIASLTSVPEIDDMYAYKLDIHDYFNSVDSEAVLEILAKVIEGQKKLYDLIKSILLEPRAYEGDNKLEIKKGIMAGTSISPFLANLYLMDIDQYFNDNHIIYYRYSDDIIIFDKDKERLESYREWLIEKLLAKGLELNPAKICSYNPHEEWEYLGISYKDGKTDISQVSLEKMKGKLRRKAHAIYRWKAKKNADSDRAIRAYIRHFNRKFYDNPKKSELTWCRWYFPLINSTERLEILDHYMQECIRYIATGKHTKANYNLRYEQIKVCGYRPLVGEFYKNRTTGK